MMKKTTLIITLCLMTVSTAKAQSLIATRNLPPHTVISADDITTGPQTIPGALTQHQAAIGLETKVAIYTGRAIRASDLNRPAVIERNQVISLVYTEGGLNIRTEGRSLARAGVGETIKAINLNSKNTVYGTVGASGQVYVGGNQ